MRRWPCKQSGVTDTPAFPAPKGHPLTHLESGAFSLQAACCPPAAPPAVLPGPCCPPPSPPAVLPQPHLLSSPGPAYCPTHSRPPPPLLLPHLLSSPGPTLAATAGNRSCLGGSLSAWHVEGPASLPLSVPLSFINRSYICKHITVLYVWCVLYV